MNEAEERLYLIKELLKEDISYRSINIPSTKDEQWQLLRSLMNVRLPKEISTEFKNVQDSYLQRINETKGYISIDDIKECYGDLYLWQGDITRLKVGAIVNAANSGMTGCYSPCHNCIDNCIHTYAGIELRNYCNDLMLKQGHEEKTGTAKITPGFNLPCDYVIHTVGPIVSGKLTKEDEELLRSCYLSCLKLADENKITSIAFCCISTGVFMFPNDIAAAVAIQTVKEYKKNTNSKIKVIFNVFKDIDYKLYRDLLK